MSSFSAVHYAHQLFIKKYCHWAVVKETEQLACVAFVDADFQQVQAIKYNETISLFRLVVSAVNAPEFFPAKLNGIAAIFTQHIEC